MRSSLRNQHPNRQMFEHPTRDTFVHKSPDIYRRLIDLGCWKYQVLNSYRVPKTMIYNFYEFYVKLVFAGPPREEMNPPSHISGKSSWINNNWRFGGKFPTSSPPQRTWVFTKYKMNDVITDEYLHILPGLLFHVEKWDRPAVIYNKSLDLHFANNHQW